MSDRWDPYSARWVNAAPPATSRTSTPMPPGAQSWFGPMQPMSPAAQDATEGRAFDYPVGYNLRITPRAGELTSFAMLRAFADSYDLLRLVIETRKDQVQSYSWSIVSANSKKEASEARIDEVTSLLKRPDREHSFKDWIRALMEDLFVLDAVAIYPRKTTGGGFYAIELIDAATIKRVIDEQGRTPMPPFPAYQQVLKGLPANDLTSEELYYCMRNYRTNRLYGMSPVEQIITTVNIALRRQVSQLDYFTEGNIPEAFGTLPESWTADQIARFQQWFDSVTTGDPSQARRRMRFFPGGTTVIRPGETILKNDFDEWLARVICFAFSISPTMLVKETNRATAQMVRNTALDEGLIPLLEWLEEHINLLLNIYFGITDVKFQWQLKNAVDEIEQAKIDQIYVAAKIRTVDEIRLDHSWGPLTEEQKQELAPAMPPALPGAKPDAFGDQQPQQEEEQAA
jgi:hypothetical protein